VVVANTLALEDKQESVGGRLFEVAPDSGALVRLAGSAISPGGDDVLASQGLGVRLLDFSAGASVLVKAGGVNNVATRGDLLGEVTVKVVGGSGTSVRVRETGFNGEGVLAKNGDGGALRGSDDDRADDRGSDEAGDIGAGELDFVSAREAEVDVGTLRRDSVGEEAVDEIVAGGTLVGVLTVTGGFISFDVFANKGKNRSFVIDDAEGTGDVRNVVAGVTDRVGTDVVTEVLAGGGHRAVPLAGLGGGGAGVRGRETGVSDDTGILGQVAGLKDAEVGALDTVDKAALEGDLGGGGVADLDGAGDRFGGVAGEVLGVVVNLVVADLLGVDVALGNNGNALETRLTVLDVVDVSNRSAGIDVLDSTLAVGGVGSCEGKGGPLSVADLERGVSSDAVALTTLAVYTGVSQAVYVTT